MKTAVEWQFEQFFNSFEKFNSGECTFNDYLKRNLEIRKQAKEIEKGQIVKHSVELMKILISNPFETSGKTPTELMDNYFKETFKQNK
jgi:hypothetical protein